MKRIEAPTFEYLLVPWLTSITELENEVRRVVSYSDAFFIGSNGFRSGSAWLSTSIWNVSSSISVTFYHCNPGNCCHDTAEVTVITQPSTQKILGISPNQNARRHCSASCRIEKSALKKTTSMQNIFLKFNNQFL